MKIYLIQERGKPIRNRDEIYISREDAEKDLWRWVIPVEIFEYDLT